MKLQRLFRKIPVDQLTGDDADHAHAGSVGLQRSLTARHLIIMGVAAIIGTGIFVLPGVAAYKHAGPAVILSFGLCGVLCMLVGLCYSELSSMIRSAGSAFMYAYVVFGEAFAWAIGWDLLLEYAFGASGVAVGFSAYFKKILFSTFGVKIPERFAHAPDSVPWGTLFQGAMIVAGACLVRWAILQAVKHITRKEKVAGTVTRFAGLLLWLPVLAAGSYAVSMIPSIDLTAMLIVVAVSVLLMCGVHHTAWATTLFVIIKIAVIVLFLLAGVWYIDPSNWSPFIPDRAPLVTKEGVHMAYGYWGILSGAAIVFFAFIGFDGVTTAAGETKDPQRDVPRGVIGSLLICTVAYMLVAVVMTGCLSYTELGGDESAAPIAKVMDHIGLKWASWAVSAGAIAGITSALILSLYGQSRIQMAMSNRGLMPAALGKVHPRLRTPVNAIVLWGAVAALVAGLIPIEELSELTNIGTLAAFIVVCLGTAVLRYSQPEKERRFKCPSLVSPVVTFVVRRATGNKQYKCIWLPDIPVAGALGCLSFMFALPLMTWERFIGWMLIGAVVYVCYGYRHSKLNDAEKKLS